MYKKGIYKILANEPLTASVWRMVLEGDTEWIVRPGQFVNIALEGRYLRRPISVCDCDARTLTLIYKVVGGGTEQMSRMAAGAELVHNLLLQILPYYPHFLFYNILFLF